MRKYMHVQSFCSSYMQLYAHDWWIFMCVSHVYECASVGERTLQLFNCGWPQALSQTVVVRLLGYIHLTSMLEFSGP